MLNNKKPELDMRRAFLILAVPLLFLFSLSAVHAARVEGLQSPAWVERGGQKLPLRPGMTLAEPDVVSTGQGGRLYLQLADGSFIRLGEGARLALETLKENDAPGNSLRGVLNLLQGAFRYTAGANGRTLQRDLGLRVAGAHIGIHGTDVWARSQDGGATVCLIEGRIEVKHPVRGEFVMDQPLSFFIAPREGEPHPVAPVEPDRLRQWTAETDLNLGQGVMLPGGGWIVQLGSHSDEAAARRAEKQLLDSGTPVQLTTVQLKSRTFYRLRVSGFDTQQDAIAFAGRIKRTHGVSKPWVTCNIPGLSCK